MQGTGDSTPAWMSAGYNPARELHQLFTRMRDTSSNGCSLEDAWRTGVYDREADPEHGEESDGPNTTFRQRDLHLAVLSYEDAIRRIDRACDAAHIPSTEDAIRTSWHHAAGKVLRQNDFSQPSNIHGYLDDTSMAMLNALAQRLDGTCPSPPAELGDAVKRWQKTIGELILEIHESDGPRTPKSEALEAAMDLNGTLKSFWTTGPRRLPNAGATAAATTAVAGAKLVHEQPADEKTAGTLRKIVMTATEITGKTISCRRSKSRRPSAHEVGRERHRETGTAGHLTARPVSYQPRGHDGRHSGEPRAARRIRRHPADPTARPGSRP